MWTLIAMVSLVGVILLALGWYVYRSSELIEQTLANDEQTMLQTSLSMLDGRLHVGLYRQHMWDALLWTVMASPDSLPPALDAPNGVITKPLSLLYTNAQLGFREPPMQLRGVSQTEAALCSTLACQTIRCVTPDRRCDLISEQ